MPTEITVEFGSLINRLGEMSFKAQQDSCELEVGYSAPYATLIHEDLLTPRRTGQAKFLEQPMRENEDAVRQLIRDMKSAGLPMRKALEAAGYLILDKSRPLVPVDTGYLRDSAFVEVR
jgi:hypothetical protein